MGAEARAAKDDGGGYFTSIIKWSPLDEGCVRVETGWIVQGVSECLRDQGPHRGLVGPWQEEENQTHSPKPGDGHCFPMIGAQQPKGGVGRKAGARVDVISRWPILPLPKSQP